MLSNLRLIADFEALDDFVTIRCVGFNPCINAFVSILSSALALERRIDLSV